MKLAGLTARALADPALARPLDWPVAATLAQVEPDGARRLAPRLSAAIAAGETVLAVPHKPTVREAEDLAAALGCRLEPRQGSRSTRLGYVAARAGSRRAHDNNCRAASRRAVCRLAHPNNEPTPPTKPSPSNNEGRARDGPLRVSSRRSLGASAQLKPSAVPGTVD